MSAKPPAAPPTIRYEEIMRTYATSLTTVLRGFKSADEFEFLDTWVPDDDHGRSIFGIIEAAKEAGLPSLAIRVTQETLRTLDLAQLAAQMSEMGPLVVERHGQDAELSVVFHRPPPSLNIHPAYQEGVRRQLQSCRHQRALEPAAGQVLAQASADGASLMVLVDPSTHVVRQAAYHGTLTPVQQGLLEGLCDQLAGYPLLDGSDHAVIRLEYALRERSQRPPVPGVITPQNADPAFALPLRLIRGVLAEYRRVTGYGEITNRYDRPTAPSWRALSSEQRMTRLQEAIQQHPDGAGMRVVRLDGPERVVLEFDASADAGEKPRRLLRLEAHLKAVIDPVLHVYLEPKWDENRPRQTKGVKL